MRSDQVYFTSDTHFGHLRIAHELRGFSSTDEMDEVLIGNWNRTVPKNAFVFHLGDVSFRALGATEAILRRLHGQKFLVQGNHDRLNAAIKSCFWGVKDLYEIKIEDTEQRIVMCHYAFRVWNRGHYGAWDLHGHSHGNLAPIGGQLDVGVDTHDLRPYSYAEVAEQMAARPFVPVDHHQPLSREGESSK